MLKGRNLRFKREIRPRLRLVELIALESQGHQNVIQDLNHQKETGSLTSLGTNQRSQEVDHPGELHRKKGKGKMKEVAKAAGLHKGKEGHLRGRKDAANHQSVEADHQGIAVTPQGEGVNLQGEGVNLQGEGVNLQGNVVGLGHHDDGVIVIDIKGATLKDKHIKGIQMQSEYLFS